MPGFLLDLFRCFSKNNLRLCQFTPKLIRWLYPQKVNLTDLWPQHIHLEQEWAQKLKSNFKADVDFSYICLIDNSLKACKCQFRNQRHICIFRFLHLKGEMHPCIYVGNIISIYNYLSGFKNNEYSRT